MQGAGCLEVRPLPYSPMRRWLSTSLKTIRAGSLSGGPLQPQSHALFQIHASSYVTPCPPQYICMYSCHGDEFMTTEFCR
jgi:hypothetical protein